jgi:hypothetical protein
MRPSSQWYGLHLALAGLAFGAVSGCGGSGATATAAAPAAASQSQPPQMHSQSLDTAQLLEQARRTSETADAYAVDGGALTLNDTSDSTDPIPVNAI